MITYAWRCFPAVLALCAATGPTATGANADFPVDAALSNRIQMAQKDASCLPVRIMKGHKTPVNAVAFNGTDKLYSGSANGTIRVWSLETGFQVTSFNAGGAVSHIAMSRDGTLLAIATSKNEVEIWDTWSGKPYNKPLRGPGGRITRMTFDKLGKRLQVLRSDNTIRWWNIRSGEVVKTWSKGEAVAATSSAEQTNSHYATHAGPSLNVWSPQGNWKTPLPLVMGQAGGESASLAKGPVVFLPGDSRQARIAAATAAGHIGLWTVRTGAKPAATFSHIPFRHPAITAMAAGNSTLGVGSEDGSIRVWLVPGGSALTKTLTGHSGRVTSLVFVKANGIASSSADGTVRLWEYTKGPQGCLMRGGPPSSMWSRGPAYTGGGLAIFAKDRHIRFKDVPGRFEGVNPGPPSAQPGRSRDQLPEPVRQALSREPTVYLHGPSGVKAARIDTYRLAQGRQCGEPPVAKVYGLDASGHQAWFASRRGTPGDNDFVPAKRLETAQPAGLTDDRIRKAVRGPFNSVKTYRLPGGKTTQFLVQVRAKRQVHGDGYAADYVADGNYVFLMTGGKMRLLTDVFGFLDKCGRRPALAFMGTIQFGDDAIPDLLLGPNPYTVVERTPKGESIMSIGAEPCMC